MNDHIQNLEPSSHDENHSSIDFEHTSLRDLPLSANHAVIYQLLLRVLGEDYPAGKLFSLSDDELIALPGIGYTKLNKIHNYIEFVQNKNYLDAPEDEVLTELDESKLSLLLSSLEIPQEFRVARKAVLVGLGASATVGDVLSLTGFDILKLPKVGEKKVEEILTLQKALQQGKLLSTDEDSEPDSLLDAAILERLFSEVAIPSKYKVEKGILQSICGQKATIADILAIGRSVLSKQQSVGRKKIEKVMAFQDIIRSGSLVDLDVDTNELSVPEADDSEDEETSLLEALEPLLIDAMDHYINELSESKRYVFCSRHGIDCEYLTLEQVGKSYPRGAVTRERIRQLQNPLDRDWPLSMGVSPRKLWFSVQEHLSLLHEPALQNWKSRFHKENNFFDFLALSCGVAVPQIRAIVFPKFSKRILDGFWSDHVSPAQITDVVDYLVEETGHEVAVLENILYRLCESGDLHIKDNQITPLNLAKPLAIANIMLRMPDGATWETVHRATNESGICRANCRLDRMDHGINEAVDKGWIYQSGSGSYRHVEFVKISDAWADEILKNLKCALEDAKNNGRDALNLMTGFFQYHSFQKDYFTVRHCVRTYGEREGIFFNGKSGADTVSLDAEFSLVSQEASIVEFIARQKGSVTLEQIAGIIRSQSLAHANLYGENLFAAGHIVKVAESVYDTPEKVLAGIETDLVVATAAIIIEDEPRIIEIDILRKRLNRRLNLLMNKYLVRFILQHESKKFGYHWYCTSDLIAKEPMLHSGISAIIRDLISQGYREADLLLEQLDRIVLANPSRVQKSIYYILRGSIQNDSAFPADTDFVAEEFSIGAFPQLSSKPIGSSQRQSIKKLAHKCRQQVEQRLQLLGDGKYQGSASAALLARVETSGFDTVLEQETGTWFNRLCALRFMEVNGYLVHRLRVFSHSDGNGFEILNHALDVVEDLDLERSEIENLKLSGTQDEVLYRKLLLAQCQQLHQWFPFLFPASENNSYLLLPDNLIRTDSLLRVLVNDLPDDYWRDPSILNELYNVHTGLYGNTSATVSAKENLQLFISPPVIPHWLARSMVENSLGRLWWQRTTDSDLDELFDYFMPEQGKENEFTQKANENTLNPETLTICDPHCGSGVFLLEAYRILREIYLKCGYRKRDIPKLILENNLFGIVYNQHSEQMTRFALLMAGRADDQRFFSRNIKLNVYLLDDSIPSEELSCESFRHEPVLQWASHATSRGYLLQDSNYTINKLQEMRSRYEDERWHQLLDQTICLQQPYDVIVTQLPSPQKVELPDLTWQLDTFGDSTDTTFNYGIDDLFSNKCLMKLNPNGFAAILSRDDWMLKPQYQNIREDHYRKRTLVCLQHLEAGAVERGKNISATVFLNDLLPSSHCQFLSIKDEDLDPQTQYPSDWNNLLDKVVTKQPQKAFNMLPGKIMAYWVSDEVRAAFKQPTSLGSHAGFMKRAPSLDRKRFLRLWHEVDFSRTFAAKRVAHQWNLYATGQSTSPWSADLRWITHVRAGIPKLTVDACCVVTHNQVRAIQLPEGATYSSTTGTLLADQKQILSLVGIINSSPFQAMTDVFRGVTGNESLSQEQLASIPLCDTSNHTIDSAVYELAELTKTDRKTLETEWTFQGLPWAPTEDAQLSVAYCDWQNQQEVIIERFLTLLKEIDHAVYAGYAMDDHLQKTKTKHDVSLRSNPLSHFPHADESEPLDTWLQSLQVTKLIGFAIGCMMGRYSLKTAGLIHAESQELDICDLIAQGVYGDFIPDQDAIVPLTYREWFDDDATNRFVAFLKYGWGEQNLQQNLHFVAESLRMKVLPVIQNEADQETIRRYLITQFHKDHLNTYEKRPVYWMFSSGKHSAFECLVYLHRYNDKTLSRMRIEYVQPLIEKYRFRINQLPIKVENATTMAESLQLQEELKNLKLMLIEIQEFNDKLKHFADKRITLNLDDGVKVNTGKFGDLLSGTRMTRRGNHS
ncbi:MAG: hypothetical protein QM501_07395 [Gimesia sp.]